jgi:hypothetical protein
MDMNNGKQGGKRFDRWLWIGVTCLPTVAIAGLVALPGTTPSIARADEPLGVAASYGAGVHAYYDGNYQAAYDALTAAIEAGTLDPRAYYYRGLTSIKLGKIDDEINGDFAEGASRETMGRGGMSISRSLERIQGRDRHRLEAYRQRARVAAVQRDEAAIRQRYIGVQETAPDVLRRRVPETVTTPVEPLNAPVPKPRGPVTRQAPAPGKAPAAPGKAPVETPEEDDPFSAPRSGRATDDPFGDEPLRDDRLDQRDEQMEESAAETDDGFDQRDRTREEGAAEFDDRLDQIDAQQEREAAGGF